MDKVSYFQQKPLIQFDWRKIVALCIKRRKKQKLTLEDIAKTSGLPIQVLQDFEAGLTNLTIQTLFRIISPLNISVDTSPHLAFLNWESFVGEAVQHRKGLALTLKDIQLSASVSYKLLKKFEDADKDIRLNKVLPILKVLAITQSRRFDKKPARENYLSRQKIKYQDSNVPETSLILLEWPKITELCTKIRHHLNMNQDELAMEACVSRPTIVNFESGITKINITSVFKIFDALNLDENLNASDRSNYFSILEWGAFIKVALNRREELCWSRNELAKIADLQFPIVTKFEKGGKDLSLQSVIKILGVLKLAVKP